MNLPIRRTHILIDFPSPEAAAAFVKAHRDAGLGTARPSGVDRDKVKIDRPGRVDLAAFEARLAAAGMSALLATVGAIRLRYEIGRREQGPEKRP